MLYSHILACWRRGVPVRPENVHTPYQIKAHLFHHFINRPAFSHLPSPSHFYSGYSHYWHHPHKFPFQISHTNVPGCKYEIQCSKLSHAFDLHDLGSIWNSLVSSKANAPYFSSVFSVHHGCLCTEIPKQCKYTCVWRKVHGKAF